MATPHVTQVPVLDRDVRKHTIKCGLPDDLELIRVTLAYANGQYTEEEFIHTFLLYDKEQQDKACKLLDTVTIHAYKEIENYS